MLTAESDGGHVKCHPYWKGGDYGPMKVKSVSEKRIRLDGPRGLSKSSLPDKIPSMMRRPSTNPPTAARTDVQENPKSPTADTPHLIVRTLILSHANQPYVPMHEITQLQYSSWPDFGAPAHPTEVLGVIEQCNTVVRSMAKPYNPADPEPPGPRPIVVHCSAGCGRTGTFCTIDSVIDTLKMQRRERAGNVQNGRMDVDDEDWVHRDDLDLIVKTVEDFRVQRLSMVQSLRQFVLCYETVLEWLVEQEDEG